MRSDIFPAALVLCFLIFTSHSRAGDANKWKPPESPKDDQHWYPEMPDNKEINESLVNGNFEEQAPEQKGQPPNPKGWAHPDDFTVLWKEEPNHGKVITIDTSMSETQAKKRQFEMREAAAKGTPVPPAPKKQALGDPAGYDAIGATYGVSFYSEKFKCKPKQAYKISFDYKGTGGAKVWVRGWGQSKGEDRRRWETFVNCHGGGSEWRHQEQAFHPTRRGAGPDSFSELAYLRIMLFAYWPPGLSSFDNLKIEEISDEVYTRMKGP